MLNLIHEKKPGVYVFHREEEIGGYGGKFFVKHRKPMLKGIKRVVSFDRMGYGDVITHQSRGRTASDKFAKSLSEQLGGGFAPSTGGSFTDSASYADIVPECTNVSVGFKHAHTQDERQNLKFARHLFGRVRDIDFEKLPTKRDPSVRDDDSYWYGDWKYSGYSPRKTIITPSIYDDEYFDREDKINRNVRTIAEEGSKDRVKKINKQLQKAQEEKKYRSFEESHDEWVRRVTPYQSAPKCKECGQTLIETATGYYCGNPGCSRYHERYEEKKQRVRSVPFDDSTFYDDFVYEDMRRKKKEGIIE